jgi:hypothetical protein
VGDAREGICVWDPFVAPGSASQAHLQERGYHRINLPYCGDQPRAPGDVDYIVTNPPFSAKGPIVSRFLTWGVPFAMILPTSCLQTKYMADALRVGCWDIYMPDCRLRFARNGEVQNTPPFLSCYVVWRPHATPDVRMHYMRRAAILDAIAEGYFN